MGQIFISHSSKDNAAAKDLRQRLTAQGYDSLFLDFHPSDGIPAGVNWQRELYQRIRACDVVLFINSKNSTSSKWCFAEITQARAIGKNLIPLSIDDAALAEPIHDLQAIKLDTDPNAYDRLWNSFNRLGISRGREKAWNKQRPPYPGLLAYQEEHARVFFGRDESIRTGLDALTRMRQLGSSRLLLVLGASGSGKSSLVRAGLLPRLKEDADHWIVLRPIRPHGGLVGNFVEAIEDVLAKSGDGLDTGREETKLRNAIEFGDTSSVTTRDVLRGFADRMRRARDNQQARVLVTIDQAEELLHAENRGKDEHQLHLLGELAQMEGWRVLVTLRSDHLGEFQNDPALAHIAECEQLSLGPIAPESLRRVIAGPAELAGVDMEPALVDALARDASAKHALPLLAFALRKLWDECIQCDGETQLRLAAYTDRVGGMEGAIESAASRIVSDIPQGSLEFSVLRRAFLRLVRTGADGTFTRRIESWDNFEQAAHPWLHRFVEDRLLVSDGEGTQRTLEVTHEALFRSWAQLADWLDDNRKLLRTRESVEADCIQWHEQHRHEDYLLPSGLPLAEAEALIASEDVELNLSEIKFIQASVARRDAEQQEQAQREELHLASEQRRREAEQKRRDAELRQREAQQREREAESRRKEEARLREEAEQRVRARATRIKVLGASVVAAVIALGAVLLLYQKARDSEKRAKRSERVANQYASKEEGLRKSAERARGEAESEKRKAIASTEEALKQRDEAESAKAIAENEREKATQASARERLAKRDAEREKARADALHLAQKAKSKALESQGGSREAVADGLKAVAIGIAREKKPSLEAEVALRLALHRLECAQPLKHHQGFVNHAEFSPDDRHVVTASDDGNATISLARNGAVLGVLDHRGVPVTFAGFCPTGDRIATCCSDGSFRVWNARTLAIISKASLPSGPALHAAFTPDGESLVIVGAGGDVLAWDVTRGQVATKMTGHEKDVVHVACSANGKHVITASWDGTARIWSTDGFLERHVLDDHSASLTCASFSRDGTLTVTSSNDGSARIWNVVTGDEVHSLKVPDSHSPMTWAGFSPNGTFVCTTSENGDVHIWSATSGDLLHRLAGHRGSVDSAAFSYDSGTLATGSSDHTVKLWDTEHGTLVHTFEGHRDRVRSVAFAHSRPEIVTASEDRIARLWRFFDPSQQHELSHHPRSVSSVATSQDGTICAIWSSNATAPFGSRVTIRNTHSGREVGQLSDIKGRIDHCSLSPDGKTIAVLSVVPAHSSAQEKGAGQVDNQIIQIRDTSTGRNLWSRVSKSQSYRTRFSPDGRWLLRIGHDNTATLLSCKDYSSESHAFKMSGYITCEAFSDDGNVLVLGNSHGDVVACSIQKNDNKHREILRANVHRRHIHAISLAPDGSLIAAASEDFTASIIETFNEKTRHYLIGHENRVSDIALSRDKKWVITAGMDKTARVWDASTGAEVLRKSHPSLVVAAEFSSSSNRFITACHDGKVRLWARTTGDLIDTLDGHDKYLRTASFANGSKQVIALSDTVRIWSVDVGDLVSRARDYVGANKGNNFLPPIESRIAPSRLSRKLPRSDFRVRQGRTAKTSLVRFEPTLRLGMKKAKESKQIALVVVSRYNPP